MNKETIFETGRQLVEQKTALAAVGSGSISSVTWFMEGVSPYIPFITLVAFLAFGFANLYINWKRAKAEINNGNQ